MQSPNRPDPLGKTSLALGVTSVALVFGIGFCGLVGLNQGWLRIGATVLYVCGASSAFLGFLALLLGFVGLFGQGKSRGPAVIGLLFGIGGILLFLAFLTAIANAG